MNRGDPWEKPWHSIPITAMPRQPVGLQSAVDLGIDRKVTIDDLRDPSRAMSCRGEFINMWYGGSTLKVALDERAELAKVEGIQATARNWLKEHLRTGKLQLFRDGPLKLWVCESQFWQRIDPTSVFMQSSILDREGDENGAYVLDAAALMALLGIDPAIDESRYPSGVARGAADSGNAEIAGKTAIDNMADWIFQKHPREKGGRPEICTRLEGEAAELEQFHPFKRADFLIAYRRVYQSERHRPPKSGWPLRDSYKKRLDSEGAPSD